MASAFSPLVENHDEAYGSDSCGERCGGNGKLYSDATSPSLDVDSALDRVVLSSVSASNWTAPTSGNVSPPIYGSNYFFLFPLTYCGSAHGPEPLQEAIASDIFGMAHPEISYTTQEPVKCSNYTAYAPCYPAPNITCKDPNGNETRFTGKEIGFYRPIPCRNVNGYSYKVAVALSLFLGWLGADRFYLGYPALGMLKFCTVGFCGIGCLIDFVLIIMQIVGPSDGSKKHRCIHEKSKHVYAKTGVSKPRKSSFARKTEVLTFVSSAEALGVKR
ncbi:hypothetical protein NDU88_002388 [Pleurodeles waltl]|uniref:TM2 domain-containing protein n=1 Tax=Pleurodeles waltl TaxID=8319 RepID=A0AAV7T395_PLEWA|nr:hypothetical protein NDU88_002388 [Pleurodeles waltl]